jgi:hypothetical protein
MTTKSGVHLLDDADPQLEVALLAGLAGEPEEVRGGEGVGPQVAEIAEGARQIGHGVRDAFEGE